jgi:hypothetical protein
MEGAMLEVLAPAAVAGVVGVLVVRRWWEQDVRGWIGDDSESATSPTFRSSKKDRSGMSDGVYWGGGGFWGFDDGGDSGCGGDGGGGGGGD